MQKQGDSANEQERAETPAFPSFPFRTAVYRALTFCTDEGVLGLFPSDSFRLDGDGEKRHMQQMRTKHAEVMQ